MSQIAPATIEHRVLKLEEWRDLTVDPKLSEHEEKLATFERIEQQVTGAIKFVKAIFAVAGGLVAIVELIRLGLALQHFGR